MKFMKRTGIYQGSNYNVTFDPKTITAVSYRWWKFVAVVEGKVVFNNYYYSNTTNKHQSKVRNLLQTLDIKVDFFMPIPQGIKPGQTLEELILIAEEHLCDSFLSQTLKRQEAYYRRKERKEAAFKAQLDSITLEDIRAHRAGLSLVPALTSEAQ